MNANLPLKTPAIKDWIDMAARQLVAGGISSGRLDAEIILAHTLRKSRTYLHAHDDDILSPREHEIADARLLLRLDRTPLAYIIGHKEFYGRQFQVTPATLVPRPETEEMITVLKQFLNTSQSLLADSTKRLVDVGTGSGCIGITAKLELPELDVTLIDNSHHALAVAKNNAKRLEADVSLLESDLLSAYPFSPHFILANLPYVDPSWERSPETDHEPSVALFARDGGLQLVNRLVEQAAHQLAMHGVLILEIDPRQHVDAVKKAKQHGFRKNTISGFIVALQKIS
jgi:release factor glutamine methyltransferase